MNQNIKQQILLRLKEIEKEHDVEILYAVESGSRAWGFASEDSDYDVRFIYRHTRDWYLQVFPKRDVIECPISNEWDFSGWDLKKSLLLMSRSNPVLFEWLHSPVVYLKKDAFYTVFEEVSRSFYLSHKAQYHYLHMAKGNYRGYLLDDQVRVKKYFYVLRPLFACLWLKENKGVPPVDFETLWHSVSTDKLLDREVQGLLDRKRVGEELDREPKNKVLNQFIEDTLLSFGDIEKELTGELPDLDSVFRTLLEI